MCGHLKQLPGGGLWVGGGGGGMGEGVYVCGSGCFVYTHITVDHVHSKCIARRACTLMHAHCSWWDVVAPPKCPVINWVYWYVCGGAVCKKTRARVDGWTGSGSVRPHACGFMVCTNRVCCSV